MNIGLIGINMYPKYLNFACGLHTYAFQQFLLQNNISSTVIDYKPVYFDNFDMLHPADYYREKYKLAEEKVADSPRAQEKKTKFLNSLRKQIAAWDVLYEEREIRYKKFRRFIDKYYVTTEEKYDSDLLEVKDPGFDCYICVTDVIWKLLPTHIYDRGFFLASKAMDGKQKIAYAASRGVPPKEYKSNAKELFFRYINDIDTISVREKSLKAFIEANSNKEATLVLDPVLLHDKAFWQAISTKPKEENYILLYYVMERASDTIDRAVEYAKKHNLLIVELSDRPVKNGRVQDDQVKHIARYDIGMEEWIGYMEHAQCIFTNSFHGCCFSVLFEKLFYAGSRNGDKVTNILETLGLQELKIPNQSELEAKVYKNRFVRKLVRAFMPGKLKEIDAFQFLPAKIDYTLVRRILEEKRIESQEYLLNAVHMAEKRLAEGENSKKSSFETYRKQILYPINYHSGKPGTTNTYDLSLPSYHMSSFSSGDFEYSQKDVLYQNDGTAVLKANKFHLAGHKFIGWKMRIKIDNRWFWYMADGSLGQADDYGEAFEGKKMLFNDKSTIPYIPVNRITLMIVEASWKN